MLAWAVALWSARTWFAALCRAGCPVLCFACGTTAVDARQHTRAYGRVLDDNILVHTAGLIALCYTGLARVWCWTWYSYNVVRENESCDWSPYLLQPIRRYYLLKYHRQSLGHVRPAWVALRGKSDKNPGHARAPQRSQWAPSSSLLCVGCAHRRREYYNLRISTFAAGNGNFEVLAAKIGAVLGEGQLPKLKMG